MTIWGYISKRVIINTFLLLIVRAEAQETGGNKIPPLQQESKAYDTIAGDLAPDIHAQGRPYFVAGDIYVPVGKAVTIEPGAVLLFKNFTGLQVQGKLIAKASKDKPIVFTSVNDRQYNRHESPDAAPYDWNGVHIHKEGVGTEMEHCIVQYAVDGIVSDTRFIRLSPCVFRNNGRINLGIEGIEHEVGNEPYEYALTMKDAKLDGVALSVFNDPMARRRAFLRYAGISLAVGGAAVGIVFSGNYAEAGREYDRISSRDPVNLATHTSADWERSYDDVRRNGAVMGLGWGGMALGTILLIWSFTF